MLSIHPLRSVLSESVPPIGYPQPLDRVDHFGFCLLFVWRWRFKTDWPFIYRGVISCRTTFTKIIGSRVLWRHRHDYRGSEPIWVVRGRCSGVFWYCGVGIKWIQWEKSKRINHFIEQTCVYSAGPKKSLCSSLFSRDTLLEYRGNCLQLINMELDLVVVAQLSALCTNSRCIPPTYRGNRDSFRPDTSFMFHGIKVCQALFICM